ncbi:hypothetical protein BGZ63DRAFT_405112 [Mariannaea sp. PMI_226]|nr:hypothetical protein BGZ63DRAFT_405112 [Mariannaea sp. PMI_226]
MTVNNISLIEPTSIKEQSVAPSEGSSRRITSSQKRAQSSDGCQLIGPRKQQKALSCTEAVEESTRTANGGEVADMSLLGNVPTILESLHYIIRPFVYMPEFNVIVCRQCRYAAVAIEVSSHLASYHRGFPMKQRTDIQYTIKKIPGIMKTQSDLSNFKYPEPNSPSIPFIEPPSPTVLSVLWWNVGMKRIHREQAERFDSKAKKKTRVANEKTEPNGWVNHVGWADHLDGLDPDLMLEAVLPIKEDELVLQGMWESLE